MVWGDGGDSLMDAVRENTDRAFSVTMDELREIVRAVIFISEPPPPPPPSPPSDPWRDEPPDLLLSLLVAIAAIAIVIAVAQFLRKG